MVLNKDFREFIELLNEKEVKYLVVGGYAVAFHGYPRYTKDIDFWIWLNRENARKTIEVIKEFGFSSLGLTEDDLLDSENVIQLGYPPARIDLLTDLVGIDFDQCFESRSVVDINGLEVNFIDLDSLIKTKILTDRPQDRIDAEQLEKGKE